VSGGADRPILGWLAQQPSEGPARSAISTRVVQLLMRLGLAAGFLALALWVAPMQMPAAATEGTDTEVDVTLHFGAGCEGEGTIQIDANGRLVGGPSDPQWGEAVHDTPISWHPGTTVHVVTAFAGPAAPRLRLVDARDGVVLSLALTPWGQPLPEDGDRLEISCTGGTYAVPDTALLPSRTLPLRPAGWSLLALAIGLALLRRRVLLPTNGGRLG